MLQLALGLSEELTSPLRGAQLLGQLIAMLAVLSLIGLTELGEDLQGDLLKHPRGVGVGAARHPGPVDRNQLGPHQPRLNTQPEHLVEQISKRPLMPANEP